jgi:hypothetical protein
LSSRGRDFASAISSRSVFTGSTGCTTRINGAGRCERHRSEVFDRVVRHFAVETGIDRELRG